MEMKKKQIIRQTCALLLSLTAGLVAVMPPSSAAASSFEVRPITLKSPLIPITKDITLANGLRLIVSEDHSSPVASIAIVYDVGARDELKDRSGFAHLFEHMMFQGSQNVEKMDHFKYIESIGGSLNASTHADFTNYFEKVPSNQIELCLWLESDRMKSLKVTPENFKNQLETVKEEKRLRVDNQPYVPAGIKLEELAFDNWANQHPTIGYFEDLEASSVEDVRNFFKTYYAPNNATMAIVGDVQADEIAKLVEKYFGTIAKVESPKRPDLTEIKQIKAKYEKIEDAQAKAPAFWVAYKAPARRDKDYYALNLLQTILSTGDSSRLYQRMVKEDKVALQVSSSYEERRGPSLFQTFVVLKPPFTAEKVRSILLEEQNKFKKELVSAEELQRAKNQILRSLFSSGSYTSLQRSLGRAEILAEYASFYGDPKLVDKDIETYMQVTPEDIQEIAKKIFQEEGSTIVDVVPKVSQEPATAPSTH
jgi:predicted Zn-dependent peptidase